MGPKKPPPPAGPAVVDTDVLIWYLRGLNSAKVFLESIPYGDRVLSSVVQMELVRGCRDRAELRRLKRFLESFFPVIVHISEEMSRRAGTLIERYALSHSMAVDDALIAATALTLKSRVATANTSDYSFVSGLTLLRFEP